MNTLTYESLAEKVENKQSEYKPDKDLDRQKKEVNIN